MEVKITSPYGVKLLTANTRLEEDITATIDSSLLPSGELTVTENGTYDVYNKETVNVNVPIPDGYIQPSGNLDITENGSYNVTDKATATVNVQSGLAINGIIEQYKVQAGKSVNAGDFVEFVKAVSWGSGTFYSSEIYGVRACKLNENSVLVAYYDKSSKYGRVRVLTLSNSTITVGTETVFNSAISYYTTVIALTENTALILYGDGGNSDYGTAVVVTINDTTITLGTKTVFQYVNAATIKAVLLSTNKVLVVYCDKDNSNYGTAIILTISGTSITTGSTKVFNKGDTSNLSCAALNDTKAIVCYKDSGNSSYGTAIILNISGTTISIGSEKVFNSANTTSPSIIALSSTKALVVYQEYANSNYGTAVVLSINGTTITAGTKTVFNSATTYFISAVVLDENSVLVAYLDYGNTSYGTAVILTINDTAISVGTKTVFHTDTIASVTPSCVALSSSSAVVFYNSSGGYYKGLTIDGTTITPNTEVSSETLVLPAETVINGIANTSGTAGETVEVYVPAPKGYTVTINNDFPYSSQYSLDDGQTWIDLDSGETVLTEVKTIKFNWNGMAMAPDGDFLASIGTTENGTDIINNWSSGPSSNITISEDTTFYIWHSDTTSMGGGAAPD